MTSKFHVDDTTKVRYGKILGRDLWTVLGLNLKFYEHFIKEDYGPWKELTGPMVDLGTYEFKIWKRWKFKPEELIMNAYAEERNESDQVHTSTKWIRVIRLVPAQDVPFFYMGCYLNELPSCKSIIWTDFFHFNI